MSDNNGLYKKFHVERTDGRSAPGEKHHGCRYFVLDLDHDPHATPALMAYAKSCQADLPALADDLKQAAWDARVWTRQNLISTLTAALYGDAKKGEHHEPSLQFIDALDAYIDARKATGDI